MIDHSRLAAIVRGGRTSQAQVLSEFRQANADDVLHLRAAFRSCDFPEISRLAHRIEGACRMFGAVRVAQSCSLVATTGRAGQITQARAAQALFERELQCLNEFLDALPAEAASMARPTRAPDEALCKNLRFLIAEDHDFQRLLARRLLLRLGAADVQEASSGAAALQIIEGGAHPIDVLVLDLQLPDMHGLDVMRVLAQSAHPVPVILVSALSPDLLEPLIEQAGAIDVRCLGAVTKPLSRTVMAAMVNALRGPPVPGRGST
jgi:CheY-like chemotaxis protein